MYDQAYHLRQLVSRIRPAADDNRQPTLQVRIFGVRQGVGASTIAAALAQYLHQVGWKVRLCNGVSRDLGKLSTVLPVGHHGQWVETVIPPGVLEQQMPMAFTTRRRREHVPSIGGQKTLLLRDSGVPNDPKELVCDHLRRCVLVTTPAPTDIMKAYALLKRTTGVPSPLLPTIVINKSADLAVGQEMASRLQRACGRFLNRDLTNLFILPILPGPGGEGEISEEIEEEDSLTGIDRSVQGGDVFGRRSEWEKTIQVIAKAVTEAGI